MDVWKRKEAISEAFQEMLMEYDWEWFCTLNLNTSTDCQRAEGYLKQWRVRMGIIDKILFGYMGVYNTIPQPHIHLLIKSKKNKLGQTVLDFNHESWESAWRDITHNDAVITPVFDPEGVAAYISGKNLPWDRSELIIPYQKRLLRKALIR